MITRVRPDEPVNPLGVIRITAESVGAAASTSHPRPQRPRLLVFPSRHPASHPAPHRFSLYRDPERGHATFQEFKNLVVAHLQAGRLPWCFRRDTGAGLQLRLVPFEAFVVTKLVAFLAENLVSRMPFKFLATFFADDLECHQGFSFLASR